MFSKEEIKRMVYIAILLALAIAMYHLLDNFKETIAFVKMLINVVSPITTGLVIAYIFNIPMKSVEGHWLAKAKVKTGLRRGLAFLITLTIGLIFFTIIFSFAIPQLASSIDQLANQVPVFAANLGIYTTDLFKRLDISQELIDSARSFWESIMQSTLSIVSGLAGQAVNIASGFVAGIFNAILSTIIAIYVLLSKERLIRTMKKLMYAFIPEGPRKLMIKFLNSLDYSFEHFIRGQLIEALVLGVLCYIGMLIFGFEYALLISVIVGLTNIIPLFGPYIGAIPSVLLLVMVDPIKALLFIVYLIVLQQIESNLIYPRVVGSSVGLSGFWIIVAVVIGNSLFGILGILIGIPLLSSIYSLLREVTNKRLKKNDIKLS